MSDKPRLMFIDFSSIAHPVYHATLNDPMPNAMSTQIIAKVRGLASGQPHVALCLDSRKSFRKELDATYKASRESKPEPFWHQYRLALETLKGDGFPQWEAEGFEADDVVASGVEAAKVGSWPVLVVSADKDLLQLVTEHVSVKSPLTGNVMTPDGVKEKFGVAPNQIQDYLAIVGDASDGIVGVKGIGAKGAAALLSIFGNLDDLYATLDKGKGEAEGVKPAQAASLLAFAERLPIVRQLLALRTDAPIDFASVLKERVPDDVATFGEDEIMADINEAMPTLSQAGAEQPPATERERGKQGWRDIGTKAVLGTEPTTELTGAEAVEGLGAFVQDVARRVAPKTGEEIHQEERAKALQSTPSPAAQAQASESQKFAAHVAQHVPVKETLAPSAALVPVVVDYERELEPRTINDAKELAKWMFDSRMFSQWGTPQAVMGTILAGRELGLSAMASLRGFMLVDGKPTLSADLIRGLVMRSGKCEYFRCTERTAERATWTTKRKGDQEETKLTYTIEEGRAAWQKDQRAWEQSNWGRRPVNMVTKTASSMLARLVYSDVIMNLYAPEEME